MCSKEVVPRHALAHNRKMVKTQRIQSEPRPRAFLSLQDLGLQCPKPLGSTQLAGLGQLSARDFLRHLKAAPFLQDNRWKHCAGAAPPGGTVRGGGGEGSTPSRHRPPNKTGTPFLVRPCRPSGSLRWEDLLKGRGKGTGGGPEGRVLRLC